MQNSEIFSRNFYYSNKFTINYNEKFTNSDEIRNNPDGNSSNIVVNEDFLNFLMNFLFEI